LAASLTARDASISKTTGSSNVRMDFSNNVFMNLPLLPWKYKFSYVNKAKMIP